MTKRMKTLGDLGERISCRYLEKKDYVIVGRNIQNSKGYKYGEIDIVALQGNTIVFVEVKTRLEKQGDKIIPEENISWKKLRNLEKIASRYMTVKKLWGLAYRFDAISVLFDPVLKKAKVRHLENIFL